MRREEHKGKEKARSQNDIFKRSGRERERERERETRRGRERNERKKLRM